MLKLTQELHKNGYVIIPNAMSKKMCDGYVAQLERAYEKYSSMYAQAGSMFYCVTYYRSF